MANPVFQPAPLAPQSSIVGGGPDEHYRFTVLTDGLLRLEYAPDRVFEDRASTMAIRRDLPTPDFRVVRRDGDLEIITSRMHLRYDCRPFSSEGLTLQVKPSISDWHSLWRFGEGQIAYYYLPGTARTLDNADGAIPMQPGVINKSGFSLLDDSRSMLFTDDNWVDSRRPGPDRHDLYIFAYGRDYPAAVRAFYAISGNQPLVPRWALGNWWCRYTAYSAGTFNALVDAFEAERIPLSVAVIDMDWHWTNVHEKVRAAGAFGWSGYSWNTDLFPDPPGFVAGLHERGISAALCDHPADGVASHEDCYVQACEAAGMDPAEGDPVPFDPVSRRLMDVYFDVSLGNLERSCELDFHWVDWQQGTHCKKPGIDPLWVLIHFHYLRNAQRVDGSGWKRPMTFARYAGPGSHRYPVGFSGDTIVTWESLAFQPEFTASSSNIGYGYWSHDIGGHMRGYRDLELLLRWIQLGVFSPIFRLHSTINPFSNKEPWVLKSPYRQLVGDAMRLRHKLIPYIYTYSHESAAGGLPLVRPAYWTHPERDEAYRHKTTFWFGEQLLVAPQVTKIARETERSSSKVFLPPGTWVDFFSGVVYDGDREVLLHRTLSEFAVLAKAGSIVPLDAADVPANDCRNPAAIEVKVFVGADAAFDLVEDDGEGETLANVEKGVTRIRFEQKSGTLTIVPPAISEAGSTINATRTWLVTFVAPATGVTEGLRKSETVRENPDGSVTVERTDVPCDSTVTVKVGENPQLAVVDAKQKMFGIIDDAQTDLDQKYKLWNVLGKDDGAFLNVALGRLRAMGLDEGLHAALEEIMTADARSWP